MWAQIHWTISTRELEGDTSEVVRAEEAIRTSAERLLMEELQWVAGKIQAV
ncbi:MAG: hypothetical protein NC930_02505 [Candidatus Omnitrophica bacterium]|nr:hypothetical protein [Candidatus Omnitrophota bacterium]